MKDPKVEDMIKELKTLMKDLNKLNVKLYKQGVSYRLNDGYDEKTVSKFIEIQHLKQTVEY
ncbi:hypothetical protein N9E09_01170 [bacterium]|jgi:hypothetical protein|nr:hypothetical protein [bacterium]